MLNKQKMVKKFSDAGLTLSFETKPLSQFLGLGAEAIFQMDIRRGFHKNNRSEYFVVFPGSDDNVVTVADVDRKFKQLVLAVKEQAREFEEVIPKARLDGMKKREGAGWMDTLKGNLGLGARLVKKRDGRYAVIHKTSSQTRHFLLGQDERQMFMCQLPRACTTVKQAHNDLKSTEVVFAEGKAKGKVIRQGEWFFLNPTSGELQVLREGIKRGSFIVMKKASINTAAGHGGKHHRVTELVKMPGGNLEHGFPTRMRNEIFVRGAVSHPDHKTIKLGSWRKVIRNREAGGSNQSVAGGTWID